MSSRYHPIRANHEQAWPFWRSIFWRGCDRGRDGLCLHRRDGYRPSDRRMGLLEVQLRLRRVLGVFAWNDNAAWRGGVCSFMALVAGAGFEPRSEEHTSELQSLMRISYAVFCLKKKIKGRQLLQTKTTYI